MTHEGALVRARCGIGYTDAMKNGLLKTPTELNQKRLGVYD